VRNSGSGAAAKKKTDKPTNRSIRKSRNLTG
jgi:hypothetical protein